MCNLNFAPGDYVRRTPGLPVRHGDQFVRPVGRVRTQAAEKPHHVVVYFPHPEDRRVLGGWVLRCQREYRICDLVPATAAQFEPTTGDPARVAAEIDRHITRAAAAGLELHPSDIEQIGEDLQIDGMAPGDWIDAMTAD